MYQAREKTILQHNHRRFMCKVLNNNNIDVYIDILLVINNTITEAAF